MAKKNKSQDDAQGRETEDKRKKKRKRKHKHKKSKTTGAHDKPNLLRTLSRTLSRTFSRKFNKINPNEEPEGAEPSTPLEEPNQTAKVVHFVEPDPSLRAHRNKQKRKKSPKPKRSKKHLENSESASISEQSDVVIIARIRTDSITPADVAASQDSSSSSDDSHLPIVDEVRANDSESTEEGVVSREKNKASTLSVIADEPTNPQSDDESSTEEAPAPPTSPPNPLPSIHSPKPNINIESLRAEDEIVSQAKGNSPHDIWDSITIQEDTEIREPSPQPDTTESAAPSKIQYFIEEYIPGGRFLIYSLIAPTSGMSLEVADSWVNTLTGFLGSGSKLISKNALPDTQPISSTLIHSASLSKVKSTDNAAPQERIKQNEFNSLALK